MREEFETELTELLDSLRGKVNIEKNQTDELFKLHNEFFPGMKEHGKTCSSCRSRVYKKMVILHEKEYKNNQ